MSNCFISPDHGSKGESDYEGQQYFLSDHTSAPLTDHTSDGHPLSFVQKPLMSHENYTQALYGLSCALICVGIVGIISKILVFTTFIKMRFEESIIFVSLDWVFSDLGLTVTMSWGGILDLFILTETGLPFDAYDVSTVTVFWPSEGLLDLNLALLSMCCCYVRFSRS